ncbi:hypothetical protein BHE74_00025276 [Ensete ventricosum]|nr:hypothetical protein BHE74_00025276 [Ensete ventricosum]
MSFLFTGDNKPLSAFCMTNVKEWDVFRNVDMDVEVSERKVYMNTDKEVALNAWRRVDRRTRERHRLVPSPHARRCFFSPRWWKKRLLANKPVLGEEISPRSLGKKHAWGEEKLFSSPRDGRRFSRRSAKKPAGENRDCESSAKSLGSPFYSPSSSFSLGIIAQIGQRRSKSTVISRFRVVAGQKQSQSMVPPSSRWSAYRSMVGSVRTARYARYSSVFPVSLDTKSKIWYRLVVGGPRAKRLSDCLLTLRYLRQLPIYSLKSFNLSFLIQFYNLISITESIARDAKLWKITRIKKKMGCNDIPPNITLAQFLRLSKDGAL